MPIRLLSALLVLVAGYLTWWSVTYAQFLWLAGAAVALVTAVGLLLHRRWAQYLWYAIALAVSTVWVIVTVHVSITGWPYDDIVSSFISLVPGMLLLALCVFGSIAVRRHFRRGTDAL